MAKVSMTVRLDQELIDRVDALAERVGMTRTDIVERSIIAGLREGESYAAKMENPVIRGVIEAALTMDESVTPDDRQQLRAVMAKAKAAASQRGKGGKR